MRVQAGIRLPRMLTLINRQCPHTPLAQPPSKQKLGHCFHPDLCREDPLELGDPWHGRLVALCGEEEELSVSWVCTLLDKFRCRDDHPFGCCGLHDVCRCVQKRWVLLGAGRRIHCVLL